MKQPSNYPGVGQFGTVIREHCEKEGIIGAVVRVTAIEPPSPSVGLRCKCGELYAVGKVHAEIGARVIYLPLEWLRRLPPPEEVIGHDYMRAGGAYVRTPAEAERILRKLGFVVKT